MTHNESQHPGDLLQTAADLAHLAIRWLGAAERAMPESAPLFSAVDIVDARTHIKKAVAKIERAGVALNSDTAHPVDPTGPLTIGSIPDDDLDRLIDATVPAPDVALSNLREAASVVDPGQLTGADNQKLFSVTSVIDDWPHRGGRFNGVAVDWFVVERSYDPRFDYATLIDRPIADCYGGSDCVDELFTADEARQFEKYLLTTHDTSVRIEEVPVPINGGHMPIGGVPVGGPSDFHMLSKHSEYNLPFQVWGYYRIDCGAAPAYDAEHEDI